MNQRKIQYNLELQQEQKYLVCRGKNIKSFVFSECTLVGGWKFKRKEENSIKTCNIKKLSEAHTQNPIFLDDVYLF